MALAKYVQSTSEVKRYQLDYTDWLDAGEQVAGTVFLPLPVTVPPLVVTNVMVLPSGLGVQYYISGGVDGTTYNISVTTTTTIGPQVKEDDVVVVIREPT